MPFYSTSTLPPAKPQQSLCSGWCTSAKPAASESLEDTLRSNITKSLFLDWSIVQEYECCQKTSAVSTRRNSCGFSWDLLWLLMMRLPAPLVLTFPEMPLMGTRNYGRPRIKTLVSVSNVETNTKMYKQNVSLISLLPLLEFYSMTPSVCLFTINSMHLKVVSKWANTSYNLIPREREVGKFLIPIIFCKEEWMHF